MGMVSDGRGFLMGVVYDGRDISFLMAVVFELYMNRFCGFVSDVLISVN